MKRTVPRDAVLVVGARAGEPWLGGTLAPLTPDALHAWAMYRALFRAALELARSADELAALYQLHDRWPASGDPACAPGRLSVGGEALTFASTSEQHLESPYFHTGAWPSDSAARSVCERCAAALRGDDVMALRARLSRELPGGASTAWAGELRRRCVLVKAMAATWKCSQLRVRRALRALESIGAVEDCGSDRYRFAPERFAIVLAAAHIDGAACAMPALLRIACRCLSRGHF